MADGVSTGYRQTNDIPQRLTDQSLARRRGVQRRRETRFLKGPVPLWWLQRAARLTNRAAVMGQIIWFLAGLLKTREQIAIGKSLCSQFGLDEKARQRALARLAEDGLILLDNGHGRSPRVTICDRLSVDAQDGREGATDRG